MTKCCQGRLICFFPHATDNTILLHNGSQGKLTSIQAANKRKSPGPQNNKCILITFSPESPRWITTSDLSLSSLGKCDMQTAAIPQANGWECIYAENNGKRQEPQILKVISLIVWKTRSWESSKWNQGASCEYTTAFSFPLFVILVGLLLRCSWNEGNWFSQSVFFVCLQYKSKM